MPGASASSTLGSQSFSCGTAEPALLGLAQGVGAQVAWLEAAEHGEGPPAGPGW
jgi:hypothetical protein